MLCCMLFGNLTRTRKKASNEKLKSYRQLDSMDCGPTCLRMIARYYGKTYSLQYLRELSHITREGVTMLGLCEAAEKIGMKTLGAKITIGQLANEIILPCILHWNHNHFIVCYNVKGKGEKQKFYINDPNMGKCVYGTKEMFRHWISGKLDGEDIGLALQVTPGINFNDIENEKEHGLKDLKSFLRYITPHWRQLMLLLIGAIVAMLLNYLTPFLSQSMVDLGIKNRDLHFIMLIMLVQLLISVSQTSIQFVQSWVSLHMNTVININLISDYLIKLTRMPLHFFEIKTMGDILQRIGDHSRVKNFLMNNLINIVFSMGTFLVFSIVLAIYNWKILTIFIVGNIFYILWILVFMRYRRELDNKAFSQGAKLQNNMVQLIQSMQEIKLNNIERQKLWEWEHIQAGMYKITTRGLRLGQIQSVGSLFFSSVTNILISFLSARMVVTGDLTLGMMVSLSFIIGQVSGPIGAFIGFAQSYQDAKISLERLGDINNKEDELKNDEEKLTEIPKYAGLNLENVSFSYSGSERNLVLRNVTVKIPYGKFTAIVGASGSGKTTLIKILQGLYQPLNGTVKIGKIPLDMIRTQIWRKNIGSVMQDGYIFSDTIAGNICLDSDNMDKKRLYNSLDMAKLTDYIESLPLNYSTKIGSEGVGLSQGQKQRILLARTLYKNVSYIFLDEATNALDANNEKAILNNMQAALKNKTVVVAAHRLSTIKHADNIIVIDKGEVVEQGTHEELLYNRSYYYKLVQNQLDACVD